MLVPLLHDCDMDGYNIARVLEREPRTSPQPVHIVDRGLFLAEAQAHRLEVERILRKKDLPTGLLPRLRPEEVAFLCGTAAGRGR